MPTMRRGIAAIALALAVPGLALAGAGRAAGDDRSRLDFWKSNYTELRREEDPRAAKAHEIFARVLRAAGRRAGVAPSLYVIKDAGTAVPLAIALPDGGIVISRRVLDICYGEPELGDDRLAFLLAHEIAHQLKDDFWHLRFFAAVELSRQDKPEDAAVEEVRRIAGLAKEALLKEMQADEYGIVYASMAGFDTRAVVTEDGRVNFFKYFASALDPGNLKGPPRDPEHPTPEARAEAVKARLAQVLDVVELFDLGLSVLPDRRFRGRLAPVRGIPPILSEPGSPSQPGDQPSSAGPQVVPRMEGAVRWFSVHAVADRRIGDPGPRDAFPRCSGVRRRSPLP
jgi:hypothetical protein